MFLCAKSIDAKTIIELGSCAGISGCYLASWKNARLITIEGSQELAKIAKANICQVSNNFVVINKLFDEALDHILPGLEEGIDMAWIDGHHEKSATIHYFERIKKRLNCGAVVLFDDIRWSYDMHEAWVILSRWPGFSHSVDLGKIGLCIWENMKTTKTKVWNYFHPFLRLVDRYRLS